MIKRAFSYLRRSTVVALVVVLAFVFIGGGQALATTYTREVYIGLGGSPNWWGAAYLTASEVVDWLQVRSLGEEVGWWYTATWDATNYQENVSQVGQSGGGQYSGLPQPCLSFLFSSGYYSWSGGGYDFKFKVLPHPSRVCP
jgi:hypothetical protein